MSCQRMRNKQVKLKHYALGVLKEMDMEVTSTKVMLELRDGTHDVLVKNLYLSCDPYMHHHLTGLDYSHHPSFRTRQVLEGFGMSKVVELRSLEFKPRDYVASWTKWEKYNVISNGEHLKTIDPSLAPLSYHLDVLDEYNI